MGDGTKLRQLGKDVIVHHIGSFLTQRDYFANLPLVCKEFRQMIRAHTRRVSDIMVVTNRTERRRFRRAIKMYPEAEWEYGYFKASVADAASIPCRRLFIYARDYDFDRKLDIRDAWTLAETCGTQAQGLNYLVLTGSHDLSQMPPLHSLQRLEIYDADCSKMVEITPQRFPCLTAIKVVTKRLEMPFVQELVKLSNIRVLHIIAEEPCRELLWRLLQSCASQLEELYLGTPPDFPNQISQLEWPRLKFFRCEPCPTLPKRLDVLYLNCSGGSMIFTMSCLYGHTFRKLILEDLAEEHYYDDDIQEWALLLAACQCTTLCVDHRGLFYFWHKVFLHPKCKLEQLSFGSGGYTLTRNRQSQVITVTGSLPD